MLFLCCLCVVSAAFLCLFCVVIPFAGLVLLLSVLSGAAPGTGSGACCSCSGFCCSALLIRAAPVRFGSVPGALPSVVPGVVVS